MKFLIFLALFLANGQSAKILGLFGHPGKSHFDIFEPLMKELARRGHEVTVISFYPQKIPLDNYTDISLVGLIEQYVNFVPFSEFEKYEKYLELAMPFFNFYGLSEMGLEACSKILPSKQIQDLIKSGEKFDLVITEIFDTDCFLGVIYKLQAPFIAMSSCTFMPWFHARFGNPSNPSYMAHMYYNQVDLTSFSKRLFNTIQDLWVTHLYSLMFDAPAQKLVNKYLGDDVPHVQEIAKNTSLMLINTHFSLLSPRPLVPGIIEIGGIHVKPAKKLPEDMEKFINESEHGVILFSLGSMLKAETLGEGKRQAFIDALKELPQRVIWKFERDLPGLPENIKIYPWLPQRDILAHDNVKAFIAHGGLLGLTEAIYSGKPVMAIPMYGDQHLNVRAAAKKGFAIELPFHEISKDKISSGIKKILSKEFFENAQKFSNEFQDRPLPPLETAVYWTEYTLRHKGAKQLKSAAVDLPAYQYYLIDVSITLGIITLTLLSLLYFSIKFMCRNVIRLFISNEKIKTN